MHTHTHTHTRARTHAHKHTHKFTRTHTHTHTHSHDLFFHTRCLWKISNYSYALRCLKLQISFRKRATNYGVLSGKISNHLHDYIAWLPILRLSLSLSLSLSHTHTHTHTTGAVGRFHICDRLHYEAAMMSRLLKDIGLFCKRSL